MRLSLFPAMPNTRRVRELKDPSSARLREGDALFALHEGTTRDRIALFSNKGVLYVMPVTDVPATTGYGEPVQSLFKFGDGERVLVSLLLSEAPIGEEKEPERPVESAKGKRAGQGDLFSGTGKGEVIELVEEARPFLVVSAGGYGFRAAPELATTTRAGRRFARVADGDELVAVVPPDGPEVLCLARSGKGLRFPLDEATELSGAGRGVILMKLDPTDRVVGAVVPPPRSKLFIQIEGAGERAVARDDFPKGHRAGKGHKVVKRGTPAGLRAEA